MAGNSGAPDGRWIGMGLVLGAAVGAVWGNVGVGAAAGLLLGACLAPALGLWRRSPSRGEDPDRPR